MTDRQQQTTLAREALTHYGLNVARLRLASHSTNAIFSVTARDGQRYALRLATPGWRTLTDLQSEAIWLDALARDTDLCVPVVTPARDGSPVVALSNGGHATLMAWLPGVLLGKRLTAANLTKMGRLFSQLHLHGAAWQPPAGFTTRRFTAFSSRGEPEVLLNAAHLATYTPEQARSLTASSERVAAEYASQAADGLRVIHCDLWHDNIKVQGSLLCPFDFEDTVWGYRLHDIAMAMLDLLETVGLARYEELLVAFRRGYAEQLAWPPGDLACLQAGRMLWKLNATAGWNDARFRKNLPLAVAVLDRFLHSGRILL